MNNESCGTTTILTEDMVPQNGDQLHDKRIRMKQFEIDAVIRAIQIAKGYDQEPLTEVEGDILLWFKLRLVHGRRGTAGVRDRE